jgi:hypothetical protein
VTDCMEWLGSGQCVGLPPLFEPRHPYAKSAGFNGLVPAQRARALRSGLRVLLASGYSEDLLVRSPADPLDVVAKPYRETDLAPRVRAEVAPLPWTVGG